MAREDEKRDEEIREKVGSGQVTTEEAGKLGGHKVRDLIEKGKEKEAEEKQE